MELFSKTYGEGYPLIILHGLFGSLENWQTLSWVFANCYRVFAVDQRNHGHSPHSPVMDYPSMAEDLREFMEQQRLSSAYLLGHSMGGKTNITTRVRPSQFFCAYYSHAGSIPKANTDIARSRPCMRRLFVVQPNFSSSASATRTSRADCFQHTFGDPSGSCCTNHFKKFGDLGSIKKLLHSSMLEKGEAVVKGQFRSIRCISRSKSRAGY